MSDVRWDVSDEDGNCPWPESATTVYEAGRMDAARMDAAFSTSPAVKARKLEPLFSTSAEARL
eukprot:5591349-Karenia_brevis.AAC.1